MTNHVHLIVRASEGYKLPDILRDYKKFTSKAIIKAIKENIQESRKEWLVEKFQTPEGIRFWEPENHPVELWSNAVIDQKLEYLPAAGWYPSKSGGARFGFQGRGLYV